MLPLRSLIAHATSVFDRLAWLTNFSASTLQAPSTCWHMHHDPTNLRSMLHAPCDPVGSINLLPMHLLSPRLNQPCYFSTYVLLYQQVVLHSQPCFHESVVSQALSIRKQQCLSGSTIIYLGNKNTCCSPRMESPYPTTCQPIKPPVKRHSVATSRHPVFFCSN